jgi:DNA-binding XRE family transcriptional regulator
LKGREQISAAAQTFLSMVSPRHTISPRERRLELGLTLRQVARRTGLSRSTLWRLESGMAVSRAARRLVAVALNVPGYTFDQEEEC